MRAVFGIFVGLGIALGTTLCETDQKRLVLHAEGDVAAALQLMSTQIAELTANLTTTSNNLAATAKDLTATKLELSETKKQLNETAKHLQQASASLSSHGSVFTRWGRTTCPNNTDIVYTGFTAGSHYSEKGGGAEYICASDQPTWGRYDSSDNGMSGNLYGTEYQFGEQGYRNGGADLFGQNVYEHDVPCCVCRSNLPTTIMIPGRNQCYPGWTMQFAGYLVSEYAGFGSSSYACLDSRPEVERGDINNDNGQLMYTVEAICGSLKCPPYVQYREVTCVVCSK